MTSNGRPSANLSDRALAVVVTTTGAVLGCLWASARLSSQVSGTDLRVCSPDWTRTSNLPINSRLLCQLSYRGMLRVEL
jgi:hypothetical protein